MKEYVRCSRCGEQNPAFRKTCEWCGARLPHSGDEYLPSGPEEEQDMDALVEPEPEAFDTSRLLEDESLRRWLNEVLGEEFVDASAPSDVQAPGEETEEEPAEVPLETTEPAPWEETGPLSEEAPLPEDLQETLATLAEQAAVEEEAEAPAPEDEVPPWLVEAPEASPEMAAGTQDISEPVPFEGPSEAPAPPAPFPEEDAREETPAEAPVSAEPFAQEPLDLGEGPQETELPPWLLEEAPEPEAEEAPLPEAEGPPETEELPPWLRSEKEEEPSLEETLLPFGPEEGETAAPTPPMEDETPTVAPESDEEAEAPVEEAEEGGPIFGEMALDEQELASLLDETAFKEEAGEEAVAEELAPGELPDWLSALRPEEEGEQVAPPVAESELAGPLAGIPDVLPVEARLADMVQKEGRPVLKLLVRKEEQQWARWLQHWIRQEEAREGTEEDVAVARPMPYWLWRVVVGLLLLAVLALVLVFGPQGRVASPPPSRGAQAFLVVAQGLPEQAVVLLAVDYNPAWASEVNHSARTALRLVEPKSPHYLVVATQPYGLTLAQDLLQSVGVPPERYTLLGYLPGDRLALALLARWPRAAFPPPVQGESPWNQPYLAGWAGLEDAALVLVVTDQATRARDWIEQLTPYLAEGTALAFAGSLQIVPVLEPYFDSQVQGWIGGMMDAAALASQTQMEIPLNLWTAWWVSWPLGLFLGVFSALTLAVVKRIRQGEEA